jgi:hypothetical protein
MKERASEVIGKEIIHSILEGSCRLSLWKRKMTGEDEDEK